MAYDSARRATVVFAGESNGVPLGDTWSFSNPTGIAVLSGSGTPRPGSTVALNLNAGLCDAGLFYQTASSLGVGPIYFGSRSLDLSFDPLFVLSIQAPLLVFVGYIGALNQFGSGSATINIPLANQLIGLQVHTAFITLSASAPMGIKSMSADAADSG